MLVLILVVAILSLLLSLGGLLVAGAVFYAQSKFNRHILAARQELAQATARMDRILQMLPQLRQM